MKFVNDIFVHKRWKHFTKDYDSDIAILVFDSRVQFTDKISPICLWSQKHEPKGKRGTVVGWGKPENEEEMLPRELDVLIRLKQECFSKNPRFAPISSSNTFCGGKDASPGPCRGDSGSGMFMRSETKHYYLRGIVSAGFLENGTCEGSSDVIYTNVYKHQNWINDIAATNELSLPIMPTYTDPSKLGPRKFNKEIFCFFESWAAGRRDDGAYTVDHLKPELCTTLVFLHAEMEDDNLKSINPWQQTLSNGEKLFRTFNGLKKKHRHLRTLLSVGSWNEGSVKYSQLAADPLRRKAFAENSAEFLVRYEFDGLHFHWEQPAHRGGAREDKENFPLLLRDIKEVYKKQNLYLSAFVRVTSDIVTKAYDLANIVQNVDALLMMTFDMAGYWNEKVAFPAALRGNGENTLESRVDFFISQGVPSDKIILGLPFFGRTFVTENEGNIGDKCTDGFAGPFYRENGFLGYNELCFMKTQHAFQTTFDVEASQAISKFRKENGLTHVVTYDTPRSVANKIKFMVEKQLGGVWTWFVSSDDFRRECEADATTFADFANKPTETKAKDSQLLRTINETLSFLTTMPEATN